MPARSPTVRRRRLGSELRRLRETAGLTIEKVAEDLECSSSKISRIETAQVTATPRDVRDMLEIYQVHGQQREELLRVAREARQKGWWQAYRDLPYSAVADLETEASSIRMYSALLVPGLLQTEDYAKALLRAIRFDLEPAGIQHRLELRMTRQSLLTREDPPALWVVLDEAVLHRLVGGRQVMRAQLQRLADAVTLPSVTVQVLPFGAGAHPGLDGPFTIIGFPDRADRDVVYIENVTSDAYIEDTDATRRYASIFDHLLATARSPADSAELFAKVAKEL
jgi:transcriptional regulator with XRE-family HTH domain